MTKLLVTGDWHLNDNPRDSYRHQWQDQLRSMIAKHKPDALIVLGDLTDAEDHHGAWLVNTMVEYFHHITRLCPVVVLMGNHDYQSRDQPFWAFLARIPRLAYVRVATPGETLQKRLSVDLRGYLFLPHTHNHERDWKELDFGSVDCIFAHQTFAGAVAERGRKLRGIPIEALPDLPVISGDVHSPQRIGKLCYVGAPYTIDFGDDYHPQVMLIDGKIGAIYSPGPQKRLVEAIAFNPLKSTTCHKGDILKVRVSIKPQQMEHWTSFKADIQRWGDKHGYIIHSVVPKLTDAQYVRKASDPANHRSDEQLVRDYGKLRDVKEQFVKTGLWLMK